MIPFLPEDQEIDNNYDGWVKYTTRLNEKIELARIRWLNRVNRPSAIRILSELFETHVKGKSDKKFDQMKVVVSSDWNRYKYDYLYDGVEIRFHYECRYNDLEKIIKYVKLNGETLYYWDDSEDRFETRPSI